MVQPMLATSGPVPVGPGWAFEVKFDGVRAVGYAGRGGLRLYSRNDRDISTSYPEVTALRLGRGVVVDGELVALDGHGRPDFGLLQHRIARHDTHPQWGRADLPGAGSAAQAGAASAAQPARSRELVGNPPAPGLVADEAVTASVMGVRGFPLASQRLGADAGVRRAVDALGDPPHLDQARLVPIFDAPHDDLPARPSHPVVVAADRGGQRCSAITRHDAQAPCATGAESVRVVWLRVDDQHHGCGCASTTQHHGQLRQPAQHQSSPAKWNVEGGRGASFRRTATSPPRDAGPGSATSASRCRAVTG